jgi:predicted MFS family arabinose efflux permease
VRAALLVAIPIAWWLGNLHIALLALVSFAVALGSQLFGATYNAFLPSVIPKDELLKSNAKVRGTTAIAEAGSFSLGGVIVGLIGAPLAVVIDAISYVMSALLIARVPDHRSREFAPESHVGHTKNEFIADLREGWRWVFAHPSLRSLLLCSALLAVFSQMMGVVYMLFVVRELGLPPSILGVLFAAGGASSLLTVIVVNNLSTRVRYGRILFGSLLTILVGLVCLAVAPSSNAWLAAIAIVLQQVVMDSGYSAFSLVEQTCKQTLATREVSGRVNGIAQWMVSVGQIIGGVAAALSISQLGSRGVLWVSAIGIAACIAYAFTVRLHDLNVPQRQNNKAAPNKDTADKEHAS